MSERRVDSTDEMSRLPDFAEVDFDATGFGPDCDPARPPAFEAGTERPRQHTSTRGGAIHIEVRAN